MGYLELFSLPKVGRKDTTEEQRNRRDKQKTNTKMIGLLTLSAIILNLSVLNTSIKR